MSLAAGYKQKGNDHFKAGQFIRCVAKMCLIFPRDRKLKQILHVKGIRTICKGRHHFY